MGEKLHRKSYFCTLPDVVTNNLAAATSRITWPLPGLLEEDGRRGGGGRSSCSADDSRKGLSLV